MSEGDAASKAKMLKKAKEAMADKKPQGIEHKIAGKKDEEITLTQADLPAHPVLHLQGNEGCSITIGEGVSVIKIMIESCKHCKITIPATAHITTSVVEIWRCDGLEVDAALEIGTLQLDMCPKLEVQFAKVEQLGQMVQAGVGELRLTFVDQPGHNTVTGTAALRAGVCPHLAEGDVTTQFTTRYIAIEDGGEKQLLTEEVLRLANDFPTTAREKAEHDKNIKQKQKALEEIAGSYLSGVKAVPETTQKALKTELAKAAKAVSTDLGAEATVDARAEYRRQLGNEQFKIGEYQQAAVHYTEAIQMKGDIPAVWCNRAMCWLKLANADKALADADECIKLDPAYTKGYFRRGVALYELARYREACESYGKVLKQDPANDQAKASLRLAERKLASEP